MAPQRESVVEDDEYFRAINERSVDDISLEFFYQPHTITLLLTCISGLLYFACTRDDSDASQNILNGIICVVFFFLIVSVLAFPNGPFTRPHPAIWRIVFGLSVLYFMLLLFLLFQTRDDIMRMMRWLYPELKDAGPDTKEYAVNCSDITVQRLVGSMDVFIVCHFFGWLTKALLIRHYGILWTMSFMWEFTEVVFAHLLPNFLECWWDSWVLDVLLCNGMGIWMGMVICRKLEIRDYHWDSIKDIHSTTGKLRRAAMQFTPASWLYVRWLDPHSTTMRVIAVWILIVGFQLIELNTFFLKHIFWVPPPHVLNMFRVMLISLISAPTIRQYYVYVTDARCKRVGTQCWVFCAILLTESIICLKFGIQLFRETVITYIIYWLVIQGLSSFICLYVCTVFAHRWNKWKNMDEDSPVHRISRNPRTISNSSDDSCFETERSIWRGGKGRAVDNNLNVYTTDQTTVLDGDSSPWKGKLEAGDSPPFSQTVRTRARDGDSIHQDEGGEDEDYTDSYNRRPNPINGYRLRSRPSTGGRTAEGRDSRAAKFLNPK